MQKNLHQNKQTIQHCRARKVKTPFSSQLRNKKTKCPSSFTLAILIPTQLQKRKARLHPYLLTHCGVFKICFTHNHLISEAHTHSFRDVSEETKKEFTALFEMGHSASSARHAHEPKLLCEAELDNQVALADRSVNPNPQDICQLYDKWRFSSYGEDNGKGLFQKLQEAVDLYKDGKGKAVLQWYDAGQDQAFSDDSCDTEDELKPSKKKKKKQRCNTPMILALCSPIMKRAHEHVQQSRDVVFVDATSSFDRQNSSIFLLSTVMPAGAVPLGVIVTSNEREDTITTGLKYLVSIFPNNAFFGEGPQLDPSLVMIDDSSAERNALTLFGNLPLPDLST